MDCEVLWDVLLDDWIDVIVIDYVLYIFEEKSQKYLQVFFGGFLV